VSLRILFADDSVTAQNMGKKILTEAGYDVIAVSNGAAAVKKIAEQKPDIIILDVYMPGYTGLEVCEKVRASIATVKTPVLLTVGKMEPYKPEDARRVRADGVIIKPFEASDLLAIIKKFEERISANAPPPPPPPRAEEPLEEMPVTPEPVQQDSKPNRYMQPVVDVPDHMASTSAFSDLLGGDPVHAMNNVAPPPAEPETAHRPIEETELPVSWRPEVDPLPIMMTSSTPPAPPAAVVAPPAPPEPPPAPVVAAPEPAPALEPAISVSAVEEPEPAKAEELATPLPIPPGPVPGRPKQIPVYQDPDAGSHEAAAPETGPLGDIDVPRELPPPEPVHEMVASAPEPVVASAPPEPPRPPVAVPAAPVIVPQAVPEPVAPAASHGIAAMPAMSSAPRRDVSDVDFEARVAAAMAAYGHQTAPRAESVPSPMESAASVAVAPPVTSTPSFEYRPPVTAPEPPRKHAEPVVAKAEPTPAPPPIMLVPVTAEEPKVETIAEPEPAPAPPAPVQEEPASTTHAAVAAKLEETLPAAAAAVAQAAGGDHDSIADAVNRVMERMKGDLVDEIVRELKKK
jgi:CheY-like chemotaxis protein